MKCTSLQLSGPVCQSSCELFYGWEWDNTPGAGCQDERWASSNKVLLEMLKHKVNTVQYRVVWDS